jgi:hypothetical protein
MSKLSKLNWLCKSKKRLCTAQLLHNRKFQLFTKRTKNREKRAGCVKVVQPAQPEKTYFGGNGH